MRAASTVSAVLLATALAAGCGGPDDPPADPINGDTWVFPVQAAVDVDLLFVVDNSGSMAGEQASLAANFPTLLGALQAGAGGLPGLHIGIVSSNVGAAGQASVPGCASQGDDGNLQVKAGCTGLTGQYIEDIVDPNAPGGRRKNYTGNLDTLFSCMAQLGTGGCGFEQHLESAYRALQPGKNPGFYRPGAALAVVIVADEDDCSTEMGAMFGDPTAGLNSPLGPRTSFRCFEFGVKCDNDPSPRAFGTRTGCRANVNSQFMFEIETYVDFLRNLKADPSLVSVAAIVGNVDDARTVVVGPDPGTPVNPSVDKSCFLVNPADPNDGAAPAIRIVDFLAGFRDRSFLGSICTASLQEPLVQIGALLGRGLGSTCVRASLTDLDPRTVCVRATGAGCEYACEVKDVLGRTPPGRQEVVVQACGENGGARPCWRVVADPARCERAPDQLSIVVDRTAPPPAGTTVEVRCVIN